MVSITLPVTGSAKESLVQMAFEECGQSGLEKTSDEVSSALRKLDAMMLEWPFSTLGYSQSGLSGGVEELTGFEPRWDQVVSLSLALRIAPKELSGNPLSADSKAALSRSLTQLQSYAAAQAMPTATMVSAVSGAGNRSRLPFIHET